MTTVSPSPTPPPPSLAVARTMARAFVDDLVDTALVAAVQRRLDAATVDVDTADGVTKVPPPKTPAPCLLPWPAMHHILTTRAAALDVAVASLPCAPCLVTTPRVLALVTGRPWPAPTQVSHHLFRLYAAAMFHLRTEGEHPARADAVRCIHDDLLRDQAHAFRDHVHDEGHFVVAYLRAYERALLKYVFVAGSPNGALFAALPGNTAPPAFHVLAMTDVALEAAEPWLTPTTLPPTGDDKRVADTAARMATLRRAWEPLI